MALFTFAVSAASSVNWPSLRRLLRSSEDAHAPRPAATSAAKPATSSLRLERSMGSRLHPLVGFPVVHLALGLVLRDAVTLLDPAYELVALAPHLIELVVRDLAPLLLHLALQLFPVAFDAFPVHFEWLRNGLKEHHQSDGNPRATRTF